MLEVSADRSVPSRVEVDRRLGFAMRHKPDDFICGMLLGIAVAVLLAVLHV
jgi:hypothetical protein